MRAGVIAPSQLPHCCNFIIMITPPLSHGFRFLNPTFLRPFTHVRPAFYGETQRVPRPQTTKPLPAINCRQHQSTGRARPPPTPFSTSAYSNLVYCSMSVTACHTLPTLHTCVAHITQLHALRPAAVLPAILHTSSGRAQQRQAPAY